LQTTGESWSLKIGPRGQRVRLYAGKQEARVGFMRDGYVAVQAAMPAIAKASYERVWRT
jgi:hypothetical protein